MRILRGHYLAPEPASNRNPNLARIGFALFFINFAFVQKKTGRQSLQTSFGLYDRLYKCTYNLLLLRAAAPALRLSIAEHLYSRCAVVVLHRLKSIFVHFFARCICAYVHLYNMSKWSDFGWSGSVHAVVDRVAKQPKKITLKNY